MHSFESFFIKLISLFFDDFIHVYSNFWLFLPTSSLLSLLPATPEIALLNSLCINLRFFFLFDSLGLIMTISMSWGLLISNYTTKENVSMIFKNHFVLLSIALSLWNFYNTKILQLRKHSLLLSNQKKTFTILLNCLRYVQNSQLFGHSFQLVLYLDTFMKMDGSISRPVSWMVGLGLESRALLIWADSNKGKLT